MSIETPCNPELRYVVLSTDFKTGDVCLAPLTDDRKSWKDGSGFLVKMPLEVIFLLNIGWHHNGHPLNSLINMKADRVQDDLIDQIYGLEYKLKRFAGCIKAALAEVETPR